MKTLAIMAAFLLSTVTANACAWGDYDCTSQRFLNSVERDSYVPPYDYGAVDRQYEADRRLRDLERDMQNIRDWEQTHPRGPLPLTCPRC